MDDDLKDYTEYFWNELPSNKRPQLVFEVLCIEYGQGDCGFTLISTEDLKKALKKLGQSDYLTLTETYLWNNADPLMVTNEVPHDRKAYFTDVKDMLKFIKKYDITIKYSLHGPVY